MKNKHTVTAFVILLALLIVDCNAQSANALIGKWFFDDLDGELAVVEFSQTHMTILSLEDDDDDAETISYSSDGSKIIFDGEEMGYTIQNGNVLILSDSYGNEYIGKKIQGNVTTLTGKYELANDMGIIETVELIDRSTVRLHMEVMGVTARPTHQYRISGSNVIITDNKDTMVLEIIGDNIIKGNTFGGMGGDSVFVKR
jgi:hypothetical protein